MLIFVVLQGRGKAVDHSGVKSCDVIICWRYPSGAVADPGSVFLLCPLLRFDDLASSAVEAASLHQLPLPV